MMNQNDWLGISGRTATELSDEDKIISILNQLADLKLGRRFQIQCPFCLGYNKRGGASLAVDEWARPNQSPFCCDSFEEVARSICGVDE